VDVPLDRRLIHAPDAAFSVADSQGSMSPPSPS
jgi:hypothetical protein